MIDTLLNKILCLFCIHFGLPGPPLDTPTELKTRPKRLKSAPRRSRRRFQSSHLGLPSPPSPFRWRQEPSGAPQERSQTLLETLPELSFGPPEPSESFQMASGTVWAPFSTKFQQILKVFWHVFPKTVCIVVSCEWTTRPFGITAFLRCNLNTLL